MVALNTPVCEFGLKAVDFSLPDFNNKVWTLQDCKGKNGLLVMFICNHCPYVKSIVTDLVKTIDALKQQGVNTVAIMSNDWNSYPDDAPDKMKDFAKQNNFNFPYLIDESQEVARAYGAVCTPDFFGYNSDLELQYRGRFDARGRNTDKAHSDNELEQAMLTVATTDVGPKEQSPSIGCSIKWRD